MGERGRCVSRAEIPMPLVRIAHVNEIVAASINAVNNPG
jgi:hypothetical protein